MPPVGTAGARLTDRVAVVAGSGHGVGRGIAVALAQEGVGVVIAGRTPEKCQAVAQEGPGSQAVGDKAVAHQCDANVRHQLEAMFNTARQPSVGSTYW